MQLPTPFELIPWLMRFNGNSNRIPDFRYIKKRKYSLQLKIHYDELTLENLANDGPVQDSARYTVASGIEAAMHEIAEIEFIESHFERLAYQWPTQSQIMFVVVSLLFIVLALIAVWQTVT